VRNFGEGHSSTSEPEIATRNGDNLDGDKEEGGETVGVAVVVVENRKKRKCSVETPRREEKAFEVRERAGCWVLRV